MVGTTTVLQPSTAATTPSQTVLQGGEGQDGDHNTWQQRCCMVTVPQCRPGATARTGTGLPLQDAGSAVLRCCTQGSTSHKPTQPPRLLLSHCCPCARQSPSSPAASCPCPAQRVPAFLADPRGSSVAFLALLSHITPRSTGMLAAGTAPCPGAVLPCWLLANNHHTS